jgi:hypothetical protein
MGQFAAYNALQVITSFRGDTSKQIRQFSVCSLMTEEAAAGGAIHLLKMQKIVLEATGVSERTVE